MSATYTIGDSKDYSTLMLAWVASPFNLSGQGVQSFDIYAKAAGYADGTIDMYDGMSNASATDYMRVRAMVSNDGDIGSGIILDVGDEVPSYFFYGLFYHYTRLEGLAFTNSVSLGSIVYILGIGPWARVDGCILTGLVNTGTNVIAGIYMNEGCIIKNNLIVEQSTGAGRRYAMDFNGSNDASNPNQIHNNAILISGSDDQNKGICNPANKDYIYLSNNYVYAPTAAFQTFGPNTHGYLDYNVSADGTADDFGGSGNRVLHAAADCFENVTPGSENLRPKQGSILKRKGRDNSSLFTTDILGYTREDWTCGAFEYFPRRVAGRMRRG